MSNLDEIWLEESMNNTNPSNPLNPSTKTNSKPKITYDDILNSLNLKVNNGKLEVIPNTTNPVPSHYNQFKTCIKKQLYANNKNINHSNNYNNNQSLPENSYIVNKYFKDYKYNSNQEPLEKIPITKEEYNKLVILELIRRKEEKKRIAQIKSKKLLFARNNISAPTSALPNNLNKLFRF